MAHLVIDWSAINECVSCYWNIRCNENGTNNGLRPVSAWFAISEIVISLVRVLLWMSVSVGISDAISHPIN